MAQQYYYIDHMGMILVAGNDTSWKDSIGRNFMGMVAYPDSYVQFLKGIEKCMRMKDGKLRPIRHPSYPYNEDCSRDHMGYMTLAFKEAGRKDLLKIINKTMTWRISDRFTHTPTTWLWNKAASGSWWYWPIWHILEWLELGMYLITNHTVRLVAPISKEMSVHDYIQAHPMPRSDRQLRMRKWMYPAYAMNHHGFDVRAAPNGPSKWLLKRAYRSLIGRTNYHQQLLYGIKVDWDKVVGYASTTGFRPGVFLNEECDRHIRYLSEEELGSLDLEKDLLQSLYLENQ